MKRVIIIDYIHLVNLFTYGGAPVLEKVVTVGGVPRVMNTTLPAYSIKMMHSWANYGYTPTIVCFDSKGSADSRKGYFTYAIKNGKLPEKAGKGWQKGYRGSRGLRQQAIIEGVDLTAALLKQGGVKIVKSSKYEASDLIAGVVAKTKLAYPDAFIDIITGDILLTSLVDERVSVFLRSRKTSYAQTPDLLKAHYVQITPSTFERFVGDTGEWKSLNAKYNTMLLKMCLRGWGGQGLNKHNEITPTRFNTLLNQLSKQGVDLGNFLRMGLPVKRYIQKDTGEVVSCSVINKENKHLYGVSYDDPVELTDAVNILRHYLDEPVIQHIKWMYNGLNANGVLRYGSTWRVPAKIQTIPDYYQADVLAKTCVAVGMQIKVT